MKKYILIIICVALPIRLVFAICILTANPKSIYASDTPSYERPALNLLNGHGFSRFETPPFTPDVHRTPGYPSFLALTYFLFGHTPQVVILLQVLMGVGVCVVTFLVGKELYGNRTGFVAALILTFDIPSIVYTSKLLTDIPFGLLYIISCFFFILFLKTEHRVHLACSGIFLSLAVLTRPIALYFFIPSSGILLMKYRIYGYKRAIISLVIFLLCSNILVAGWIYRNYSKAGILDISDIRAVNILMWRAASIRSYLTGESFQIAQQKLRNNAQKIAYQDGASSPSELHQIYLSLGKSIILKYPLIFIRLSAIGAMKMYGGTSHMTLLQSLGLYERAVPSPLTDEALAKRQQMPLLDNPHMLIMTIFCEIVLFTIYIFAVLGIIYSIKGDRLLLFFLLLIIGYCTILSAGPEAYSRFRIPFMPFIAIFAGYSINKIRMRCQTKSPFHRDRDYEILGKKIDYACKPD